MKPEGGCVKTQLRVKGSDNPNSPQWAAEVPPEVLKMGLETALERASLSLLALTLLSWLSFAGDGHLTWSDNASPEDSTARV